MTEETTELRVEHVYEKHTNCRSEGCCPICDGGLAFCVVCKQGEGELEPTCPGPRRTEQVERSLPPRPNPRVTHWAKLPDGSLAYLQSKGHENG